MIPSTSITFNDDGTAWWVVPSPEHVFRLDRPCDVCGGDCEDGPNYHTPIAWHCRDCIDGRHTSEIEVETYDLKCARCGASASLTLGMTCSDHRPTMTVKTLRVSVVEGMVLPIMDGWTTPVTLPPDAAYGKWAVKLTVAT